MHVCICFNHCCTVGKYQKDTFENINDEHKIKGNRHNLIQCWNAGKKWSATLKNIRLNWSVNFWPVHHGNNHQQQHDCVVVDIQRWWNTVLRSLLPAVGKYRILLLTFTFSANFSYFLPFKSAINRKQGMKKKLKATKNPCLGNGSGQLNNTDSSTKTLISLVMRTLDMQFPLISYWNP